LEEVGQQRIHPVSIASSQSQKQGHFSRIQQALLTLAAKRGDVELMGQLEHGERIVC
jgi:hypothetical protein